MGTTDADAVEALRKLPMLGGLDDDLLRHLAESVGRAQLASGEHLFRAGDRSDAVYVVASGRFAVVDSAAEVVREVGQGSALGELGLLSGAPRSASVVARRDSSVWKIDAETFWAFLDSSPSFQRALLRSLSATLRASRGADIRRDQRVIAVVPSSTAAPLDAAVDALDGALGAFGTVGVLRADDDPALTREALGARHGPALDRLEQAHDWVLVVGSTGATWREFAASQADRVVVIVADQRPPEWLARPLEDPTDLVICREGVDLVAWWDAVMPTSQVLAGGPTPTSLAPLARRLARRSVGLVLSGGGARGLSHLGVYAELVEAGVVIDRVGGTSAGALAGSMFALGHEPDQAIELARRHLVGPKSLSDYTLPLVSLIRAGRLERLGAEIYGDTRLEELPKSFFTVSADMVSGEMVVHRRGPLWPAIRASLSIPGLLPPVRLGDRLLVDGALMNNLPADIMAASPDGPIICVDLRRRYEPGRGLSVLGLHPPPALGQLLWGNRHRLPSLQETLMRTVDLASSVSDPSLVPDVAAVIRPDVSRIGVLDLHQIDAAIAAGRVATRAVLDVQPELLG